MGGIRPESRRSARTVGLNGAAAVLGIVGALFAAAPASADSWQSNISCAQQCRITSNTAAGVTQHYHNGKSVWFDNVGTKANSSFWTGGGTRTVGVFTDGGAIYSKSASCVCLTQPCPV